MRAAAYRFSIPVSSRLESRAQLEQRYGPPADAERPAGRIQRAREDAQQGGLPRAVGADDAHHLARGDAQVNAAQGPVVAVSDHPPPTRPLEDAMPRVAVVLEALRELLDLDHGVGLRRRA